MMKIVAGFGLLGLGGVLLFLPGPGALTMGFGLALLAAEYVWAQRLLTNFKKQTQRLRGALAFRAKT